VGIAGRTRNTTSVYNIVLGQDDQVESYLFTPDGITKIQALNYIKDRHTNLLLIVQGSLLL
jgi:hypothetical protein